MSPKTPLLSALLSLTLPLAGWSAPKGKWAHDSSDLAPDPAVTWGVLENGVRYAILPNAEPPGRISLRLFVDAGSLMETDEQQGLAHFIEHMAFNGTTNFPAGEMVEYFQRLGMSFGGDTNAHTSFDETVYKLELPKPDEALLKRSLLLLRDYADGMLMSVEEIEKERGVILSELITRDSAEWRTQKVAYKFALPDSLISSRFPIGTKEVIKGAGRGTFMDFYEGWYTPDRLAVVAVGAVDPEKLVPMIEAQFGSMAAGDPRPDPALGEITTGRGVITKSHYERESSETSVSIEAVRPYEWRPDDTAKGIRDTKLWIATDILDNRLSELAKKEGAPFTGGGAYADEFLDFAGFASIYVTCEPDKWEGALAVAEQEIRRALEHGFTEAEFEEVKANIRNVYEQDLRSAASRKSRGLADELVDSISSGYVFSSPAQDMEWYDKHVGTITREACLEEFRKVWAGDDRQIFVGGNAQLEGKGGQILAAYKKSGAVPVEAPAEAAAAKFAYTDFGKPGEIAERKEVSDLGITQLRFANNVRLNLKRTDFEKDSISIAVRIGGGLLTAAEDKPGLAMVASGTFTAGGLEAHDADELRRIFAGKTVGGTFSVGEDAFVLRGGTNNKDLAEALQLLCAYITAPGYREESLRQMHKQVDPLFAQLDHTPMGVMQNEVDPFLKSGDFRAGFPEREELLARTLDEVKAWLAEPLAKGYMEVGIVGDFDEAALLEAAAATFGALPERRQEKPGFAERRKLKFVGGGEGKTFGFDSEIPKAMVGVYWATEDIWDIARTRRLSVLGSIFADRLRKKVREELGDAYSPYARNIPSSTYTGFGYLMSLLTVDPQDAEEIAAVVRGIGEGLAAEGTGEDELERTVKPLLTGIDQQLRNNSYWLDTVVLSSQEFPQKLDWARTMRDDYASVSVGEVNALAKKYLAPGLAVETLIVPEGGDEGAGGAAE